MAISRAATVQDYLAELPADRRAIVAAVRDVIRKHLPKGYVEQMSFGMIGYNVPLSRLPNTFNKQPLCYAGLASQKNYCSLYLMTVYGDPVQAAWFKSEFKKAGKKLDMGKSCVRFKQLDDLPLPLIGQVIAATPMERYVEIYEASRKK